MKIMRSEDKLKWLECYLIFHASISYEYTKEAAHIVRFSDYIKKLNDRGWYFFCTNTDCRVITRGPISLTREEIFRLLREINITT